MKKIKTAKNIKKAKIKAKQDKNRKTSPINNMKKLALSNSQIRSFENVLSNLLVGPNSNLI